MLIAILGGIASGKSLVAEILHGWGAAVFHADAVGHEALFDNAVKEQLRQAFGEKIFGADGEIDRRRLAELVFAETPESEERLQRLNKIVHPYILSKWETFRQENADTPIVLDAALLLELGLHRQCDIILFIDTPLPRRHHFAAIRGWSPSELAARERRQLPLNQKHAAATHILDNSGDRESLETQLRGLPINFPD